MKFKFPEGSWDQRIEPIPGGYVAMWKTEFGGCVEELDSDEVEEFSDYTEEDYAHGYISDPGAWYED